MRREGMFNSAYLHVNLLNVDWYGLGMSTQDPQEDINERKNWRLQMSLNVVMCCICA